MWTYYVVVDVIICNHEEVKIEPKKIVSVTHFLTSQFTS